MSQVEGVPARELKTKTSFRGLVLKARPDEAGATIHSIEPQIIRGRSSSSAAFPIGATPSPRPLPGRKHSNTISSVRRPLPSPPKITIATTPPAPPTPQLAPQTPASVPGRPLPQVVTSPASGGLSPPPANVRPVRPKRSRTHSASGRIPLNIRPFARNATSALDANIDAAHNTLVLRPLKSPERTKPLGVRSPERGMNRHFVTSPERNPLPSASTITPPLRTPPTPPTPHAIPAFIARRPEQSATRPPHSRTNSATTAVTLASSSPPSTGGLRLNTSFASPGSFVLSHTTVSESTPLPSATPSPSSSSVKPLPPTKSRTLPLAPFSAQQVPQPSITSPHSHPPGAIASPTVSSAASSSWSTSYNAPDSSSTVATPDTVSTSASLVTPDSIVSTHSGSLRSSVAARRMGMLTDVRVRSGSVDDDLASRIGGPVIMRSAPALTHSPHEDDENELPSIPSHLKGKGKAWDPSLRSSRSMDIDDYDPLSPPMPLKPKRRRKGSSSSSSGDRQEVPASSIQIQDSKPLHQRPSQPQLLIPPSPAPSLHPFGSTGLSPTSDNERPSPLSFHHSPMGSSSSSSRSPQVHQPHQSNLRVQPVVATPSPLSQSPVSPIGSSEGEDEHSHPALLDDMISLAPSLKARDSAYYPSGLTFSSRRQTGSRKKRRSMAAESMYTTTTIEEDESSSRSHLPSNVPSPHSSPIDPPAGEHGIFDNEYDPHSSPVSPFSARPGSSDGGEVHPGSSDGCSTQGPTYNWAAAMNKGPPSLSGRRGRGKGGRRRQSWGGRGSDISTSPISVSPPSAKLVSPARLAGRRDGSISPIQYAKRRASLESLLSDDEMDVEHEMMFAYASDHDDEDEEEGGLDVLGMPRAPRRRGTIASRTSTKSGVGKGMFVDDSDDDLSFSRSRRSRSRSKRDGRGTGGGRFESEPPLPPLPISARQPHHQHHPSMQSYSNAFPSIQSRVLAPSRPLVAPASSVPSSNRATPTSDQFDPAAISEYPAVVGTPFGMGLASSGKEPTSLFGFSGFSSGKSKKQTPSIVKPDPKAKATDAAVAARRAKSVDSPTSPSFGFSSLPGAAFGMTAGPTVYPQPSAFKSPSINTQSSGDGGGRPSTSGSGHGGSNHSHASVPVTTSGGFGGIGASPSAPVGSLRTTKKEKERGGLPFGIA